MNEWLPWEQIVWMLATFCSLHFNLNRGEPGKNPPAHPHQFLAPWILPGRIPVDAPIRNYPYVPAAPPPSPEQQQALAAEWERSPESWDD